MKFTIQKEVLTKAINTVSRATTGKLILPFTSHVLITAGEDGVTFAATNLEITIRTIIKQDIESAGEVLIPSKLFGEFISSLPNDSVTLDAEEWKKMNVRCGRLKASFNGINPSDFPPVEDRTGIAIQVEADDLRKAISRVIHATGNDVMFPVLSGVFVEGESGELRLTALDRFRLASQKILIGEIIEPITMIIPGMVMNEVARLCADSPVEITASKEKVWFSIGDTDVSASLLAGEYPKYQQYLPQNPIKVIVDNGDFLPVVKTTRLFGDDVNTTVKLVANTDGIKLSAINAYGNNESVVDAEVSGECVIGFNGKYLAEMLGIMGDGKIQFSLADGKTSAILSIVDDESFIGLQMPIYLQETKEEKVA